MVLVLGPWSGHGTMGKQAGIKLVSGPPLASMDFYHGPHACMQCMHVCMYGCMCVRTYVCLPVCLSACLPACMHACMCMCYIYIYICTRITVLDIIYIYILYNKHINHKNQNTCCHPEKATTMISIRQPSINNIMLINHPEHSSA